MALIGSNEPALYAIYFDKAPIMVCLSDENGDYRLALDEAKTGIAFILFVKGNQINENPIVYLKTADSCEFVNGSIKLNSVGTYVFEVYLNQNFVGNVTIIVE